MHNRSLDKTPLLSLLRGGEEDLSGVLVHSSTFIVEDRQMLVPMSHGQVEALVIV